MTEDPKIVAFNAWRRRRALEAGLQSADALLDEWKFKRILISQPKDIYDLESLRLLTAPLFAQYGQDLLALAQGRPTNDELPASARRKLEEDDSPSTPRVRGSGAVRHTPSRSRTVHENAGVRRDDPLVKLQGTKGEQNRKAITDFEASPAHHSLRGAAFEFRCQTLSFKFWETEFLEGWGALLDGLADGSVAPETEDELAAVALAKRERKAVKEWEQAWTKLVLRRQYESA